MDVRRPRAVLWDMDGTIIDSEPIWLAAEQEMLARSGIELSEETARLLIGSGLRDAAQHFQQLGVPLDVEAIITEWADRVGPAIARGEAQWRPGARELLGSLNAHGIPCALVTMSVRPIADALLSLLPDGTFAAAIAGDEVEFEKPHPDPYLRAAAALNVPIDECLVIEDSPTGLRSATAAGAVAVGVPNILPLVEGSANAIWPSLSGWDADRLCSSYAALRPVE